MEPELILTNGRVVTENAVRTGCVVVRSGRIAELGDQPAATAAAMDLEGDYLLPGLVELHTDNLERHFEPRPGVLWPSAAAAVFAHDGQMVSAGITTVLDAVCVGEYRDGGKRRYILNESIAAVKHARSNGFLRADHHLHLRCEVTDPYVVEMFDPYAEEPLVRLVSLMDHTPGQRQWRNLAKFRQFHKGEGATEDDIRDMLAQGEELQARYAAKHRFQLLDRCRSRGIPTASHDDESEEHVREAVHDGMAMAEFPTTLAAAAHARKAGLRVVMGSPNLVRGGSHSGNVSAGELARAGLLDGLSSDYVPVSLLHAAFLLSGNYGLGLADAVRTVSAHPADIVGLTDRGRIAPGLRADLIRVRLVESFPVIRAVWRAGERVL